MSEHQDSVQAENVVVPRRPWGESMTGVSSSLVLAGTASPMGALSAQPHREDDDSHREAEHQIGTKHFP